MKKVAFLFIALISASLVAAKVELPQLFQSGMVLQRGQEIPIWGTAAPGERVSVTFKKKTFETTADANGCWQVVLPKQKAGGPFQLKVESLGLKDNGSANVQPSTEDVQLLEDIMIGDVWLLSGQSNIDVTIERVYPQYGKVIDDYQNPQIRMFRVQTDTDTHGPKHDVKPTPINWKPVTKDNAWLFSAVGYFLGREMFEKTGVPQGVIVNSVGGTPIQAWLDADTLRKNHPREYQRTLFFQDDEMVRSMQRSNMMAQNRWQKMLTDTDPGYRDHYTAREYDDSKWEVKNAFNRLPNGRQQSNNLTRDFRYTGSFYARQHITIDAVHAGKPCRLLVGTLYDADQTYVNGRQVGSTGYQYPPRRYQIPAGVLVEGDNALTVRFVTKGGAPHFIPEKPYKLIFDDGTEVQLSEQWRTKEGARMPNCPGADTGGQNLPSVLYNAMHYPLAPYALSGMVWYQGESNTDLGSGYEQYLTELVTGWRQLWKSPELPFVIVQLANFMDPSDRPQDTGWSQVREAQRLVAKKQPNTELACIIDLGETVDIHPLRKREVAQRIALGFERMLWNKKISLSPEVIQSNTQGERVVLSLDQPLLNNGTLYEFELAGADRRFQNAEARGEGSTITLTSPISEPKYIRYAWKNNPLRANAFGKNGLPLSPFQMEIGK
ncbi:MAG: sialate O-acetylesterase [Prevotella sp.]|nr:sialate O-acetylesterase [Prevotella sp.]